MLADAEPFQVMLLILWGTIKPFKHGERRAIGWRMNIKSKRKVGSLLRESPWQSSLYLCRTFKHGGMANHSWYTQAKESAWHLATWVTICWIRLAPVQLGMLFSTVARQIRTKEDLQWISPKLYPSNQVFCFLQEAKHMEGNKNPKLPGLGFPTNLRMGRKGGDNQCPL